MLALNTDRTRIQQVGLEGHDVTQNLLVSLGSSLQTSPTFWFSLINGMVYQVVVTSPQYRVGSLDTLLHTPVTSSHGSAAQVGGPWLLGNLTQVSPAMQSQAVSHYDITPVVDAYTAVWGRDLGIVAKEVWRAVDDIRPKLPHNAQATVRGQMNTIELLFLGLSVGLVMAIVLVCLLTVANFQPRVDPLIIVIALSAALTGTTRILFLTGTTLSMLSFMGATMMMGVTTANSILLISFTHERLAESITPVQAASEAGTIRLRSVSVTVLAMIIGMVPMALGLGEGTKQNVPLGRAVIGGLLSVAISTLFLVPVVSTSVYSKLQWRAAWRS